MFSADRELKTICALMTGPGSAAVAVIRLSGLDAFKIIQKSCPSLIKKKLESHKSYLAKFFDQNNNLIDQPLITLFSKGQSYTGDETVEISCHGSMYIVKKVIDTLIVFGATTAEKGEFTYRAFMNDKIDLVQAEAVLSVIQSQSENSLKISLRQLEGESSKIYRSFEDQMTWCLAHIEASIDFSTEGLDIVDPKALLDKLSTLKKDLNLLISTYNQGKIIKDGVKIVLAGQPNVGKSSLLNNLVLDEKAIVTHIAGTTRDVIESETGFSGYKFKISDTAGLRETSDVVEMIGVERSKSETLKADINVFIYDLVVGISANDLKILKGLTGQVLLVGNKLDQSVEKTITTETTKKLQEALPANHIKGHVLVSALDPRARDIILTKTLELLGTSQYIDNSVISSVWQHELTSQAAESINQVINELESGLGYEFVAQSLKKSLMDVQKILGKVYDDQILDRVFKEFCLGK